MHRRLLVPLLILALSLAGAACGDDGSDGSGDEDQITESIEIAATTTDPAKCTENQTQRFNEQTNAPASGAEATSACENTAEDVPAEEVEVSGVEIDGDSATAEVAFTGSLLDGQTLEIGLVEEEDRWKLDELIAFVDFDRDAFVSSISAGTQDAPAEVSDCIRQRIEELSDQELQDLFLSPDPEAEQGIFQRCFEGAEEGGGGA